MGRKRSRVRILFTILGMFIIFLAQAEGGMVGHDAPELANTVWINSAPLKLADLRGKVILLEFWTYG